MKKFFICLSFIVLTTLLYSQTDVSLTNFILTNVVEVTNEIIDINYIDETNFVTNYVIVTNVIYLTNLFFDHCENYGYTVQAGIFLNRSLAEKLTKKLQRKNFKAYIVYSYPYYKVWVGKNLNKNGAKFILKKMKKNSFSGILKRES